MTLDGLTIDQAAAAWGISRKLAYQRIGKRGYRLSGKLLVRNASVNELEDEIVRRLASAPPSTPCSRCGAARWCDHRRAAA